MSNQIGLILSFLFLSIFISFTNEIIHYQTFVSTFQLQANQAAYLLQKDGIINETTFKKEYGFKTIHYDYTKKTNYYLYTLTITKEYSAISDLYQFLNKDIVNTYQIYRKG